MPASDLPALHTFAAVAQHGSFRKAAHELGLSPSAVSHAVSGLEQRLGLQLLQRTTRSVSLTQEGRVLLNGLSPALDRIDKALDAARTVGPGLAGSLRIAAPRAAAEPLLMPLILAFRTRFPQVDVTLQVDAGPRDIVADGYDFGVGFEDVKARDMAGLGIGYGSRTLLVAAPAYQEKRGLPETPDDLNEHVCVVQMTAEGEPMPWPLRHGNERIQLLPDPLLAFDDERLVREAVLAGAGIGQGYDYTLRADLDAGRLVEVLPGWSSAPDRCYLYWPRQLAVKPVNQAFIDFIRRAGEGILVWQSRRAG